MRSNVLVYLSGPITAAHGFSVEQNVASALAVYLDCIRRGIPVFCPHLTAAFPSAFDVPYETWMAYDFAVIDRCTHVLMLPRWIYSKGACREAEYAQERRVPIYYTLDLLDAALGAIADASGRLIAPPQTEPAVRPDGPWDSNGK